VKPFQLTRGLASPVTTMVVQRARDWIQELLTHHPPLTLEDVTGLGLIDLIGVLDRGDEATGRSPHPDIADASHVVLFVARPLLVEVGWVRHPRHSDSVDDRVSAILEHFQPWFAAFQQAVAHPDADARTSRIAGLLRERRAQASVLNRALADANVTALELIDEDRRAIAREAKSLDYVSTPDPAHVQAELVLATPAAFHVTDANGWSGLDRRGLLRRLRQSGVTNEHERTRLRRHLKRANLLASEADLVPFEDTESPHPSDDPAGTAQGIHDAVALIRQCAHTPQERKLAWAIAFGNADTLTDVAHERKIAPSTARQMTFRMRRRRPV
jgi:hypothetical protein